MKNDIDVRDSAFLSDFLHIALDCSLGFLLSLLFFPPVTIANLFVTLLGALGGVLPDVLQFAYWKIRREPLTSLQKFHVWIHTKHRIVQSTIGLPFQGAITTLVVLITRYAMI